MSTLDAMLSQEDAYICKDYILRDRDCDDASSVLSEDEVLFNRACRSAMLRWCNQVIDFVKFQRETVEYALSYFDRFQTASAMEAYRDRPNFQLAFVTCLYLAIKLHEPTTMSPEIFSRLSQGEYRIPDIEQMEATILQALAWRLNPPTTLAFVREFLALLPTSQLPATLMHTVYDLAQVQTELTLEDYRFSSIRKSTVAVAALMNALESLRSDEHITWSLARRANLSLRDLEDVTQARTLLYQVIADAPQNVAGLFCCGTTSSTSSLHTGGPSCRVLGKAARRGSCQHNSPRSVYNNIR